MKNKLEEFKGDEPNNEQYSFMPDPPDPDIPPQKPPVKPPGGDD